MSVVVACLLTLLLLTHSTLMNNADKTMALNNPIESAYDERIPTKSTEDIKLPEETAFPRYLAEVHGASRPPSLACSGQCILSTNSTSRPQNILNFLQPDRYRFNLGIFLRRFRRLSRWFNKKPEKILVATRKMIIKRNPPKDVATCDKDDNYVFVENYELPSNATKANVNLNFQIDYDQLDEVKGERQIPTLNVNLNLQYLQTDEPDFECKESDNANLTSAADPDANLPAIIIFVLMLVSLTVCVISVWYGLVRSERNNKNFDPNYDNAYVKNPYLQNVRENGHHSKFHKGQMLNSHVVNTENRIEADDNELSSLDDRVEYRADSFVGGRLNAVRSAPVNCTARTGDMGHDAGVASDLELSSRSNDYRHNQRPPRTKMPIEHSHHKPKCPIHCQHSKHNDTKKSPRKKSKVSHHKLGPSPIPSLPEVPIPTHPNSGIFVINPDLNTILNQDVRGLDLQSISSTSSSPNSTSSLVTSSNDISGKGSNQVLHLYPDLKDKDIGILSLLNTAGKDIQSTARKWIT